MEKGKHQMNMWVVIFGCKNGIVLRYKMRRIQGKPGQNYVRPYMSRNPDFIEWTSQLKALYEHRSETIKKDYRKNIGRLF